MSKYIRYCLTCDPKKSRTPTALKTTAGCCQACETIADYFACPKCNVVKEKQNTMYYHMSKCTGSTDHKCKHCPFMTVQKNALDLHMLARHPEEATKESIQKKESICCPWPECPFKSLTAGNLRVHFMRVHFAAKCTAALEREEGEPEYCCNLCAKEFKNSTHFYYHIAPCMIEYNQLNKIQVRMVEKVI
jgi:hypothetical protein